MSSGPAGADQDPLTARAPKAHRASVQEGQLEWIATQSIGLRFGQRREREGGFVPQVFLLADSGYDTYATTIETS